jgi:hypothetical protein
MERRMILVGLEQGDVSLHDLVKRCWRKDATQFMPDLLASMWVSVSGATSEPRALFILLPGDEAAAWF